MIDMDPAYQGIDEDITRRAIESAGQEGQHVEVEAFTDPETGDEMFYAFTMDTAKFDELMEKERTQALRRLQASGSYFNTDRPFARWDESIEMPTKLSWQIVVEQPTFVVSPTRWGAFHASTSRHQSQAGPANS